MYLIIPAKNEAHRITATLTDYLQAFADLRLMVVLNNCTDDTEAVVRHVQADFPDRLELVVLPERNGNTKGYAVREGLRRALTQQPTETWFGFIDADNSVSPVEFAKLIPYTAEAKVVVSSRYLPDSLLKDRDAFFRIVASYVFRKLTAVLFHLKVVDTQCGGKLYHREILEKILPRSRVSDMTFDVEFLYLARRSGATLKEVPIIWRENKASTISTSFLQFLKTSIQMFFSLIQIKFWHK